MKKAKARKVIKMQNDKPQVIYGMPIIVTKDSEAASRLSKTWVYRPGAIWLLPSDAILLMPTEYEKPDKDAEK